MRRLERRGWFDHRRGLYGLVLLRFVFRRLAFRGLLRRRLMFLRRARLGFAFRLRVFLNHVSLGRRGRPLWLRSPVSALPAQLPFRRVLQSHAGEQAIGVAGDKGLGIVLEQLLRHRARLAASAHAAGDAGQRVAFQHPIHFQTLRFGGGSRFDRRMGVQQHRVVFLRLELARRHFQPEGEHRLGHRLLGTQLHIEAAFGHFLDMRHDGGHQAHLLSAGLALGRHREQGQTRRLRLIQGATLQGQLQQQGLAQTRTQSGVAQPQRIQPRGDINAGQRLLALLPRRRGFVARPIAAVIHLELAHQPARRPTQIHGETQQRLRITGGALDLDFLNTAIRLADDGKLQITGGTAVSGQQRIAVAVGQAHQHIVGGFLVHHWDLRQERLSIGGQHPDRPQTGRSRRRQAQTGQQQRDLTHACLERHERISPPSFFEAAAQQVANRFL